MRKIELKIRVAVKKYILFVLERSNNNLFNNGVFEMNIEVLFVTKTKQMINSILWLTTDYFWLSLASGLWVKFIIIVIKIIVIITINNL